ncbi:MAG TPA: PFL family protein [Candidatus Acidoferrales bacterium]|nr:PFL family protein [Candidatus Acidoferrales bacterium]
MNPSIRRVAFCRAKEEVMIFSADEILETLDMILYEHLDIRTVTVGVNLAGCARDNPERMAQAVHDQIVLKASDLCAEADRAQARYSLPIVNKRVSVTPIGSLIDVHPKAGPMIALAMDEAARELNVDFIGGYSALVQKGFTIGTEALVDSIPQALHETEKVCASVNIATTNAGINMDAALRMGRIIKELARIDPQLCTRLVTFANAPADNPFMAGAFHGPGEPESVVNIGISGPGVIRAVIEKMGDCDLNELADAVKRTAFKITRVGELVGKEIAARMNVDFGIVDLSLAPTPQTGDSVAQIIESMGIERCGAPGTTAALAMLTDAVKKGGAMASSRVGGLSGAFIPVSEDAGMADAMRVGSIGVEKLEAMTSVCSVGLDMVCVPSATSAESIAGIIADECAIGVINNKTTAVRLIPIGKEEDWIEFGGLLGAAPVARLNTFSARKFVQRGGSIPAPLISLTN